MGVVTVSRLWVYPVKSCAGVAVERAVLGARGLEHDREWMLVDANGRFVSQRTHPIMATIRVALSSGALVAEAAGADPLTLPRGAAGPRRTALVWDDTVTVEHAGDEAARWFSAVLGSPVDLVRMATDAERRVDPRYGRAADQVGLADGYPLLLLSEASLDELNRRLPAPVAMNRFRPNLVVTGCSAHAEDGWSELRVGGMSLFPVKACARCAITTVDQATGVRSAEPLRTLATYRTVGGKILFGQNVVHDGRGELRVGDPCEVSARSGA